MATLEATSFAVAQSPTAGRSIQISHPIPARAGTPVLDALPYALAVFHSHRKRLCACLPCSLATNASGFAYRCGTCDDAYYCPEGCKRKDEGFRRRICTSLKKLKGWNQGWELVREGNHADETDRLRRQFYSTLRNSFHTRNLVISWSYNRILKNGRLRT